MSKKDSAPMGGRRSTLLLVDDHELVRSGMKLLLETCLGHTVVEARSASEALEIARTQVPDVVLLDVCMPEHDGLWALQQLREEHPELPVVMLSTFDDGDYIRRSLDAGAAGYVLKEAVMQQVAESIECAIERRGIYLHPVAARRLVGKQRETTIEVLTEREREVLALLVDGAQNDEIAKMLFITEKTVKTHLSAIFRKLGVTNRTQAATKAIRVKLVAEAS